MLLSTGLKSPHCKLEILRLSGCQILEKGCIFLVSALNSNRSHLRELDLSFNHPGDSGVNLLFTAKDDPNCKLETLKIDHCAAYRLKPSPYRDFCEHSLDPNTANRNLLLSDDNRRVMVVTEKQPYPDHPERFDHWTQLLCSEGLTGPCYWEVEWRGELHPAVTDRGIKRRGDTSVSGLAAGTVSFYCLPSRGSWIKRIHLHTFHSTFTQPLYPAFGFGLSTPKLWNNNFLWIVDGL
ncbi:stonustoxin subunit beta-like [Morone saxatilis]|uniref:stonustoxin subunit beta-like n=1 Tax=Morone saxatilis TaxID=34816 RepID=UPI0015E22C9E|nr:stonustoxin subunit beta-like [Morone saxatilis]